MSQEPVANREVKRVMLNAQTVTWHHPNVLYVIDKKGDFHRVRTMLNRTTTKPSKQFVICFQSDPGKDVCKRIVKGHLLSAHLSADGALANAQLKAHHDGLILFLPNVILVRK